jgi:PAS domain-containing protein
LRRRTEAETVRRRKDGGVTDVHITGAPVFARGQRVGTWGIYHDISERKAQERARAALLEREREARAAAEAATRRAAFLADVGTLLSAAFVRQAGYQELARMAVAELADYCVIDEVTPYGATATRAARRCWCPTPSTRRTATPSGARFCRWCARARRCWCPR